MTITFNVTISLSQDTKDWIMSQLSDAIAKVTAAADTAIARVSSDVKQLEDQIAALQTQIDAGGASPADLAALDALQAKLDALDPTSPVTLP